MMASDVLGANAWSALSFHPVAGAGAIMAASIPLLFISALLVLLLTEGLAMSEWRDSDDDDDDFGEDGEEIMLVVGGGEDEGLPGDAYEPDRARMAMQILAMHADGAALPGPVLRAAEEYVVCWLKGASYCE